MSGLHHPLIAPKGLVRSKKPPPRRSPDENRSPSPQDVEKSVAALEYEKLRQGAVLENAEALIDDQQAKIQELVSHLEASDRARNQVVSHANNEVKQVVEENASLRCRVDHLNADIAASAFRSHESERLNQVMAEELAHSENAIAEKMRDNQVLSQQLGSLPAEVSRLNIVNRNLAEEVERLTRDSIGMGSTTLRDQSSLEDRLAEVKRDLETHQDIARELNARAEESRIAKRCVVQVEADLLEHQTLVQEQREELQKLYKVIDALNKEKALMPPVVLATTARGGKPKRDKRRGEEATPQKPAQTEAPQYQPQSDGHTYSVTNIQQLRIIEEQRDLMAKLLEALESVTSRQIDIMDKDVRRFKRDPSSFWSSDVLHAMGLAGAAAPPVLKRRICSVKPGELYVFDTPKDREPICILPAWRCHTSIDPEALQFIIRFSPTETADIEQDELHFIRVKDSDSFNRWYFALVYAGFISFEGAGAAPSTTSSTSVSSSPTTTFRSNASLPALPTLPPPTVEGGKVSPQYREIASGTLFAAGGRRPDGMGMPFVTKDCLWSGDGQSFRFTDASTGAKNDPAEMPMHMTEVTADPAKYEFIIELISPPPCPLQPVRYVLQAASEKEFRAALERLTPLPLKQLKLLESASPAPLPEVPRPKVDEEDDDDDDDDDDDGIMVVKNGELKLYERVGDDPILQIKGADCFTTATPEDRSIQIRYKPGTHEEEMYVFEFDSDADFNKWKGRLENNDFFTMKEEKAKSTNQNEVCVVTLGVLNMYKGYGSDSVELILSLKANECKLETNKERKEVVIIHRKPGTDKRERITLDCGSTLEFERWILAFTFGGFLRDDQSESRPTGKLSKYIFPINFSKGKPAQNSLVVEKDHLKIMPVPTPCDPVYTIYKETHQCTAIETSRRFRFYKNITPAIGRCIIKQTQARRRAFGHRDAHFK
eukprot:GHVN01020470.1.p1 GENE.GHVN01020470.1~~GHVN01020470.1.p1  ORF type:complete len:942 (+),score=113.49 GHVN01020470.1:58-2883(+)